MKPCGCKLRQRNKFIAEAYYSWKTKIVYCPLHRNAERMKEFIKDVLSYYDESRDDCAICSKGIFGGHTNTCFINEAQALLKEIGE